MTLLEASGLYTDDKKALQLRGDGIQGLAVAGILAYLTGAKRNDFYYWGFEEPENSLEYLKSTKLANEIEKNHSRRAQMFLTTHSPAFLTMENAKTSTYRVHKRLEPEYKGRSEEVSDLEPVFLGQKNIQNRLIADELGFFDLVRQIDREYREFEALKERYRSLEQKIHQLTKPILIVEGP